MKTSAANALFVGSANLDRHASLLVPHIFGTSNCATITEVAGGVALNMASRFAACGGDATLVTALGNDAAAAMIRKTLRDRHVALEAALTDRTGTFVSILEPGGELVTAISDMAALDDFDPDLPERLYDWTVIDANLPRRAVTRLADAAKTRLALVTVSIAKAPRIADALAHAAIVFTNTPELAALSGGAAEPFRWFREQTQAILVASDGPRPLWLMDGDEITPFPIIQVDQIVDVVGAGDALAGTMLHALATGHSTRDALVAGLDASARTVQVAGPYLPQISASV